MIRNEIAHAKTQYEDLEEMVLCTNSALCKLIDRIDQIDKRIVSIVERIDSYETISKSSAYRSAERATDLERIVRQRGYITRGQAAKYLKCHLSSADQAMSRAAEIYTDLQYFKNNSKKWVLAVKK